MAIPVVSLLAVLMGFRKSPPTWVRRTIAGGTVLTVIATWIAVQTGEAFNDIVDGRVDTDRHEDLANTTMLLVFGLGLAVCALAYVMGRAGAESNVYLRRARLALAAVTMAFAVLSTVWVVRTGEEGARLVWDGVIPEDGDG